MARKKAKPCTFTFYDFNYKILPADVITFNDGKEMQIWKMAKELDIGYSDLQKLVFAMIREKEIVKVTRKGKTLPIKCHKTVKVYNPDEEELFSNLSHEMEEMERKREKAELEEYVKIYKRIHKWEDD